MAALASAWCVVWMGWLGVVATPEPQDLLVAFVAEAPPRWHGLAVEAVTPGVGRVRLDSGPGAWAELSEAARQDARVVRLEPNLRFHVQGDDTDRWLRRGMCATPRGPCGGSPPRGGG